MPKMLADGFHDLARCRKDAFPNRISSINLNLKEHDAARTVALVPTSSSGQSAAHQPSFAWQVVVQEWSDPAESRSSKVAQKGVEETPKDEDAPMVRRRKVLETTSDASDGEAHPFCNAENATSGSDPAPGALQDPGEDSEEELAPPQVSQNPLYWFSALPPPSLRRAQANFVQAVAFSVELARISRDLQSQTKAADR